jgi:nicotinamide-nucleotide amidase
MRETWILSCGTELTLGQTVDTNAAWLAGQLAALGYRSVRHVTLPDDAVALRETLLQAAAVCDVVLLTGGLGPTVDDVTREALAAAAGVPLEVHPPSLEQMRAFFAARGREMPARNAVQAQIPLGATALPNTCGTAPGIGLRIGGKACYALPGVPFEMRAMFVQCVAPELRGTAAGEILLCRELHTFGLGESDLGVRIEDLMRRGRNPEVGTTAQFGQVDIRINAAAPTHADAEALLDQTEAELRHRLGAVVFGREADTLASVVGTLLLAQAWKLSTAESCTGGLIGHLLTDVPGASRYYVGGVVAYANEAKADALGVDRTALAAHGAVSEVVAREMAVGAARGFHTECAVAVTGIAGPDGGTAQKPVGLVYIGLHTPAGTSVCEYRFGPDAPRDVIRLRAARTALNLLRLALLDPAAGCCRLKPQGHRILPTIFLMFG